MYLKSLTLKGFKSFADRTVLKFQPGVAAVVGPNGSGKSNISDAVLWVLGERNAKNLRGQSMEDVIFSGSSARKPVSLAEVELLLDNSDGTLPVDFDEVSIGRRMYRSGESEYLINGNVVRRMDVLDILHDSGLGTGTHSIISQGNLDSVLSSKPEDRRALIEEAAGILKHKERKLKSERKLERMDNHVARVIDVTTEVERQLKPLERKAKKALTFQELDATRRELKLSISVDNLRNLQMQWEHIEEREKNFTLQLNDHQNSLSQAEKELEDLQKQLQERGFVQTNLNTNLRGVQNARERLNSAKMLLREKRRQASQELERVVRLFEESKISERRAQEELASATDQYHEAKTAYLEVQEKQVKQESDYAALVDERNGIRKKIDTLTAEQRGFVHKQETIEAAQKALRENLSATRAKAEVLKAQLLDAQTRLDSSRAEKEELLKLEQSTLEEYEAVQLEANTARSNLNQCLQKRDQARKDLDSARDELTKVSAERSALEELERASSELNPVRAWLDDQTHGFDSSFVPLINAIKVPPQLESLVEALLGEGLQALLFSEDATMISAIKSLLEEKCAGSAYFAGSSFGGASGVSGEAGASVASVATGASGASGMPGESGASAYGRRLLDELEIDNQHKQAVSVLLGDVYLAEDVSKALEFAQKAQQTHAPYARFVSLDGCVVDSQGRIMLLALPSDELKEGALSRRRRYEKLCDEETVCETTFNNLQASLSTIEEKLRDYQSASLKLSEKVAHLKGQSESAQKNAQRAQETFASVEQEFATLKEEQKKNEEFLSKSQPDSDDLEENLSTVIAQIEQNKEQIDQFQKTLSPLQKKIITASEALSDLRLSSARLSERYLYAERMVETRKQEIASSNKTHDDAHKRKGFAQAVIARIDPLMETLSTLMDGLTALEAKLEAKALDAQSRSQGLHDSIAQATKKVHSLHDLFDKTSAQISEVRVEKGRLEIQVEAAIKVITDECSTSLETALKLEPLEEREEAVSQLQSLERRIKNLGTINPDAAKEYELIKERYDFLASQLADMKSARSALSRIVSVIDERMRDDFVDTFNQVNDNFSEIFSTLFPGGQAHLSLVDPDDLENTGVDVNAQPVGKRVKKMSLLSGGEKSMTAMALLFAVYRIRQTPFYILDEVEAALDDSNLRRLMAYLEAIRHTTQFIMITHQRRTMETADILYGVSMQADGVTKVLSQKIEQATSKGA